MPSDRIIRENILVPTGKIIPAGEYLYSLDGEFAALNDTFEVGDIAFFDPRTNMTVGAGVTPTTVPKLGIAVAIDKEGKGYPTVLRKVYSDAVDSKSSIKLTTEPASYGCNQIVDFYTTCTFKGEVYTIEIHTRGDTELTQQHWNNWKKETFSVNLRDYACESCEDGIDTQAVMCALAKKINAHRIPRDVNRVGKLFKRMISKRADLREWTAYPIFVNDCTYTITNFSPETCTDCTHISGINGIIIDGGAPVVFNTAALVGDDSITPRAKKERVIALINKAFRDAGVEGSAVLDEQLTGSGAPCADFKIRINSCVTFDLFDSENVNLTKVCTNPLTAITTDPECIGCAQGSTWTPTGGIRVVSHGMEITCNVDDIDRTYWFHREIRIAVPEAINNWSKFVTKTIQKAKAPHGLGIQWKKRLIDMSNGGPGFDYDNFVNDFNGIYRARRKNIAFDAATKGLECKDGYCSINIEHGLPFKDISVNGGLNEAKGRSILLMNNKYSVLYAAVKAVMDPWFTALGHGAINCSTDVDQIEAVVYSTGLPTGNAAFDKTADTGK